MTRLSILVASLFVLVGLNSARAQVQVDGSNSHMVIADPATLSGARAESVYRSIRWTLAQRYLDSGDPVAGAYQNWKRYNTVPYRSSLHGELFVNNYANPVAQRYGRFEKLGRLPPGAIVIKDSFTVTKRGEVMTGPLFLMEKKEAGFNKASNDWLYMTVQADGSIEGITGGRGGENVEFCAACHNKAPAGQDILFFCRKKSGNRIRRCRPCN